MQTQVLVGLIVQPFSLLIQSKLFLPPQQVLIPTSQLDLATLLSWKLPHSEGNSVRLRRMLWWDWFSSAYH